MKGDAQHEKQRSRHSGQPRIIVRGSASRNPGIQKVLDSRFRGKDGRVELGTAVYSEKSADESGKI